MGNCASVSVHSLEATMGFMASAVPWCFAESPTVLLQDSGPTVGKILPSYLPKCLSSAYLSKYY